MTRKESKSLVNPGPASTKYDWFALLAQSSFTLASDKFVVIIGAMSDLGVTPGNIAANARFLYIIVTDAAGHTIDSWTGDGLNYVAAPATGGAATFFGLPRKMLVPPGGKINTSLPANSYLSLVQCASLDDALAIL